MTGRETLALLLPEQNESDIPAFFSSPQTKADVSFLSCEVLYFCGNLASYVTSDSPLFLCKTGCGGHTFLPLTGE